MGGIEIFSLKENVGEHTPRNRGEGRGGDRRCEERKEKVSRKKKGFMRAEYFVPIIITARC